MSKAALYPRYDAEGFYLFRKVDGKVQKIATFDNSADGYAARAAWNACDAIGATTEALEAGVLREMMDLVARCGSKDPDAMAYTHERARAILAKLNKDAD